MSKTDNEVYMVLLMKQGEQVRFVPAAYDTSKQPGEGGRLVDPDEAAKFGDFVAEVHEDMDAVTANIVMDATKAIRENGTEAAALADLHAKLLATFGELPMELVGNMLATQLIGTSLSFAEEDTFDELYAEWQTSRNETA